MQNEVAEVEPKQNEITVIANKITSGLAAFETRKTELTELKKNAEGLTISSLDDKESIGKVSLWRKKLKSARVEIEKEGKSMRDPLTRISKSISLKENELIDIISPTETALKSQEDWVKAEEEKLRLEDDRRDQERIQNRIDRLATYGYAIDITFLKGLNDEQFEGVVSGAKLEFEKEEEKKAEAERLKAQEHEQILKDQAELKALREKQEEADRIIKEQQERIEKDRLEKEKRDKQEADRLALEAEYEHQREEDEKKRAEDARIKNVKDAAFEIRKDRMVKMGFVIHGVDFSLKDTWSCYWEQVYNPNDEDWDSYVMAIEDAIERRKIRLSEEEKQRTIDLENARLKGIADEQERQRLAAVKKQEELEKAGDKAIWSDFISRLKEVESPTMRSGQYRKIALIAREKLDEILKLRVG